MEALKLLLTEPIGILSLITVGVSILIIVFLAIFFLKNSGKKSGDSESGQ